MGVAFFSDSRFGLLFHSELKLTWLFLSGASHTHLIDTDIELIDED